MPKLLDLACEKFNWPPRGDIMNPRGAGPNVIVNLAKRKLKTAIKQLDLEVEIGILAANPNSDKTEDPLAIVCEFNNKIPEDKLRILQRLAWSFSHSPVLVTIEPSLLRAWTCWNKPLEENTPLTKLLVQKYSPDRADLFDEDSLSGQAANSLQWIELVSGEFLKKHSKYFRRNQRADQLMLGDLRCLRGKLLDKKLPQDICHDLIARIIFIEFLFQRKDSKGNAALNKRVLKSLHDKGVLLNLHKDFVSVLKSHDETYRFFKELNDRFNGDLFPGKGETSEDREKEWQAEMDEVKESHLKLLVQFVSGKMEVSTGQYCLWRRYAFDVIPLEFISSIYEEFVSSKTEAEEKENKGTHYTPAFIVDFILDEVLPWNSKKWNLKILDPACGSGIFLVKAYQRLLYRYKKSQGTLKIKDIRGLLENNLFGVDINRDAVRVASFSLYLAMCDEIDPKHIWPKNVRFPRLRDKKLIESDFFAENKGGFQTDHDQGTYDLVIGNAPWGHDIATDLASKWAVRNQRDTWQIQYKSPGPLFLVKAAYLAKKNGLISMIQPAQALLTNRQKKAVDFRNKFFNKYKVNKIINLSILRFGLFKDSISPACIVELTPKTPDGEAFKYICPKPTYSKEDDYKILIEPNDINCIFPEEAANENEIWSTLMWGGRRDLALIRMLKEKNNLGKFSKEGWVNKRQGIIRGDRKKDQKAIKGKPILETNSVPPGTFLFIDPQKLPKNNDIQVHSRDSTDFTAFSTPQLIIRQSWKSKERFSSFLVPFNKSIDGIICSRSYISVHANKDYSGLLEAACLSYNSILAVYYLFLTSGRCSAYIPEALVEEIMAVPLPDHEEGAINTMVNYRDIDLHIRKIFKFKDAEWVLIEDLFDYTLPSFKSDTTLVGKQTTRGSDHEKKDILEDYCCYFSKVLKAGFGEEKNISATIFAETGNSLLPVRLVAIHLDSPRGACVKTEPINCQELMDRLKQLDAKYLDSEDKRKGGGIFYRRVARIYDTVEMDGRKVPTIYLVKPDKIRYWTRSMALRDADEVAADIRHWKNDT